MSLAPSQIWSPCKFPGGCNLFSRGNVGLFESPSDLSYNNITGSIPASLTQLQTLQNLKLDVNQLSGNLPDMNTPALQSMYVYKMLLLQCGTYGLK